MKIAQNMLIVYGFIMKFSCNYQTPTLEQTFHDIRLMLEAKQVNINDIIFTVV